MFISKLTIYLTCLHIYKDKYILSFQLTFCLNIGINLFIKLILFIHLISIFSFQDKISKTRYWPIEVFKMAANQGAKGKKVCTIL